jgi:hypothetical protein
MPADMENISPLGGISKVDMVMCNERGKWINYTSDRYGFNNDNSVYENNSGERIILLGDSFMQGWCVETENSFARQLRAKNRDVINLASGGNGPLTELALIKEYAIPLKAKYILWVYNDTDLMDLRNEYEAVFLQRYLADDYSQNLINRQKEIDRFWKKFIIKNGYFYKDGDLAKGDDITIASGVTKEQNLSGKIRNSMVLDSFYTMRTIITLHNIRRILGFTRKNNIDIEPILKQAKKIADEQGIKLYFVYIPINNINQMVRKEFSFRSKVVKIAEKLNIPVIDFEKHIRREKDYLAFFPYKIGKHYNAKGYSFLADVVDKEMFKGHNQNRN